MEKINLTSKSNKTSNQAQSIIKLREIEIKQTTEDIPSSRAFFIAGLTSDRREIFIHGGSDKEKEFNHIYFLGIKSLNFRNILNVSTIEEFFIFDLAISGHTSNNVIHQGENKIIIFGGFDGSNYLNSTFLLDSGKLVKLEGFVFEKPVDYLEGEYPEPRCYHTANFYEEDDSLLIYGGWNSSLIKLNNENFTSLWKFRLKYNAWEKVKLLNLDNVETKRGHSSELVGDILYMFGGIQNFNRYTNDLVIINLNVFDIT